MNELFRPDADVVFLLLHFVDSQEFCSKFADFAGIDLAVPIFRIGDPVRRIDRPSRRLP